MGKYWDWYEVEFDRVARKLNPERRAEILDSLREHVADASTEFSAKGIKDEDAERRAVRNLGAPIDIVRAELDTPKRQWLPVWAAAVGIGWCAAWLVAGSLRWTMGMIYPALWLTPFAVLVATLISKRTKLWALGGLTASLGLGTLTILSLTWLHLRLAGGLGYLPLWDVSGYSQELNQKLVHQASKIDSFDQLATAFKQNDRTKAFSETYEEGKGWRTPTGFWVGYEQAEYRYVTTYEEARAAWMKNSARTKSGLQERATEYSRSQAALTDPRAYAPTRVFAENVPSFAAASVGTFCVLALSHILGLTLVRIRATFERRRWRVAL